MTAPLILAAGGATAALVGLAAAFDAGLGRWRRPVAGAFALASAGFAAASQMTGGAL